MSIGHLTSSKNMLNEIFDFLPGCIIIHKIALLNKQVRHGLTNLEPFGRGRIITLKISDACFFSLKKISSGLFGNDEEIRGKNGFNLVLLKKLLGFTNNLRLEINDSNFECATRVIEIINFTAPDKKIYLIHDTNFSIPKDLQIYSLDFKS